MLRYKALVGTSIDFAVSEMTQIANTKGQPVQSEFNGVGLIAEPGMDPALLLRFWESEMDRAQEAYWNSPPGRQAAADAERRKQEAQATVARLTEELSCLDFSDLDAVMHWMERVPDHVDAPLPRELILRAFHTHGFERNACTGDAFKAEDRENFARWVIGQGLDGIASVGAPHGILGKFAQDWREKFESPGKDR